MAHCLFLAASPEYVLAEWYVLDLYLVLVGPLDGHILAPFAGISGQRTRGEEPLDLATKNEL